MGDIIKYLNDIANVQPGDLNVLSKLNLKNEKGEIISDLSIITNNDSFIKLPQETQFKLLILFGLTKIIPLDTNTIIWNKFKEVVQNTDKQIKKDKEDIEKQMKEKLEKLEKDIKDKDNEISRLKGPMYTGRRSPGPITMHSGMDQTKTIFGPNMTDDLVMRQSLIDGSRYIVPRSGSNSPPILPMGKGQIPMSLPFMSALSSPYGFSGGSKYKKKHHTFGGALSSLNEYETTETMTEYPEQDNDGQEPIEPETVEPEFEEEPQYGGKKYHIKKMKH